MKKLRKGFTLIELLVVVAIIAILATIVLINVAGARAKAINAKVLSELADDRKEAVACFIDSGTVTNPITTAGGPICEYNKGIAGTWANFATGYGKWGWSSTYSKGGDSFRMVACSDSGDCGDGVAFVACSSGSTCVSGTTTGSGGSGIPPAVPATGDDSAS